MTRLGLFGARADRRGLAALSENIFRNMAPAKTLVMDMAMHRPFAATPERFPGAEVVTYDEAMARTDWFEWLEGLDVLLCLETPYTFAIFDEARRCGVRSILLLMAEYDPYHRGGALPHPDVIALPTPWLAHRHPGSVQLPIPVEPFTTRPGERVLHPAGSPAAMDRNGTHLFLAACRHMDRALVRAQEPPDQPWHGAEVVVADFPTNREVYDDAQVVVLPRRYGGLSLAVQDALAAGLPVLHTDTAPYGPQLPVEARLPVVQRGVLHAKGGSVAMLSTSPEHIAKAVRDVQNDPGLREHLAAASRAWADQHSWEALRPVWDAGLAG